MTRKNQMASKLSYYTSLICLLSIYTKLTIGSTDLHSITLPVIPNADTVNTLGRSNSSLGAYELGTPHQQQVTAENSSSQSFESKQNTTNQRSYLNPDALEKSTTAGPLPPRPKVPQDDPNMTHDVTVSSENSQEFLDNDNTPFLSNLTSSENLTNADVDNTTHYIIWKHFLNFTHFLHEKYVGDDKEKKDSRVKTFFRAHKLLALFLGMAGILACLFILVYCIYIRQHKEEMFSHHRLYGEGFEDPVLHLDTPVDHLDFFSFRDTELSPAATPQQKGHSTETYEAQEDYKAEAPKGISPNEHLPQIIQMGSIRFS